VERVIDDTILGQNVKSEAHKAASHDHNYNREYIVHSHRIPNTLKRRVVNNEQKISFKVMFKDVYR